MHASFRHLQSLAESRALSSTALPAPRHGSNLDHPTSPQSPWSHWASWHASNHAEAAGTSPTAQQSSPTTATAVTAEQRTSFSYPQSPPNKAPLTPHALSQVMHSPHQGSARRTLSVPAAGSSHTSPTTQRPSAASFWVVSGPSRNAALSWQE